MKCVSFFGLNGHRGVQVMTSLTNVLGKGSPSGQLRPLDPRRDLGDVADLVETCFADTLDVDGQRYIQQMRAMARNPSYLGWVGSLADKVSVPISGFVWEEDRRVVGNLTLIPYLVHGKRYYLIANVAVDPAYRRRGIGRRLTARAIEHARQRSIAWVWLHVRDDNEGAITLYKSLGFNERARRSTWYSNGQPSRSATTPAKTTEEIPNRPKIIIGSRRMEDWSAQRAWLEQLYPSELTWHLNLKASALQPGVMSFLYRTINDINTRQWSAWMGKRLLGVLAWHSSNAYADNLWLASNAESEETAAGVLLRYARQQLSARRPLSLDYPAGRAVQGIQAAGFHLHQTLIWMSIETASSKT
jgi:ribosomal protein S18 acetylase RimI-like enzyme